MGAGEKANALVSGVEEGGSVPYDAVKDVVKSAVSGQPTTEPDKGIGFAIIQANESVALSIQRNTSAEDRNFVRGTLSKITKFFIDQIGAIGFLPNTEKLVVVTCFEFASHDGGTSNGAEFAKEIKQVRQQAQVFVYEKGQKVTPDDVKGGVVDGLIRANTSDPDDHSSLLQFLRNQLTEFRLEQIERSTTS